MSVNPSSSFRQKLEAVGAILNPLKPIKKILSLINHLALFIFRQISYPHKMYMHFKYKNYVFKDITTEESYSKASSLFKKLVTNNKFTVQELKRMEIELQECRDNLDGGLLTDNLFNQEASDAYVSIRVDAPLADIPPPAAEEAVALPAAAVAIVDVPPVDILPDVAEEAAALPAAAISAAVAVDVPPAAEAEEPVASWQAIIPIEGVEESCDSPLALSQPPSPDLLSPRRVAPSATQLSLEVDGKQFFAASAFAARPSEERIPVSINPNLAIGLAALGNPGGSSFSSPLASPPKAMTPPKLKAIVEGEDESSISEEHAALCSPTQQLSPASSLLSPAESAESDETLESKSSSESEDGQDEHQPQASIQQPQALARVVSVPLLNEQQESEKSLPISRSYSTPSLLIAPAAASSSGVLANVVYSCKNALGLIESGEEKHISWKIRRFEIVIEELQKKVSLYIQENELEYVSLEYILKDNQADWTAVIGPFLTKLMQGPLPNAHRHFSLEHLDSLRHFYNDDLLENIRKAATWAKDHRDDSKAHHVDAICSIMYTSLDLNKCCFNTYRTFIKLSKEAEKLKGEEKAGYLQYLSSFLPSFNAHVGHPALPAEPEFNLIRKLLKRYEQIRTAPIEAKAPKIKTLANSLIGTINGCAGVFSFDPNKQSNLPHVILEKTIVYPDGTTHRIRDIAMGSPTIEFGKQVAEINPEFRSMLRHYQHTGQVHFYVNNQNYIGKVIGNEIARCDAIHALATGEFAGVFYAITLSQNSSFYNQKSPASEDFKAELIAEVFDKDKNKTGNYIPKSLDEKLNLKNWGIAAAATIHSILFENRANLTKEERKVFIRIFYRHLTRHIINGLKPASYNVSCKDRIDRGASSDAEDFANLLILNNLESDKKAIAFFETMIFSRALIVRKRVIIEEHFLRLYETVKFMLENKANIVELNATLFPGMQFPLS